MNTRASMGGRQDETARQREQLARWLVEWRLDRLLRCAQAALEGAGDAGPRPFPRQDGAAGWASAAAPAGQDPAPALGQVRLVSPAIRAGQAHPLYLAVFALAGRTHWRVAPYGRFSEPALPGELATGREEPCLRVLCLWNSRVVPATLLGDCWLAGSMDDDEQAAAVQVFEGLGAGGDPPPPLKTRVGPPLWHPGDPRHDYVAEETLLLDALAAGERAGSLPPRRPAVYEAGTDGEALPMAAEPAAGYRLARTWRAGGDAELRAEGDAGGQWQGRLVFADGTPWTAFDRGALAAPGLNALAPIDRCRVTFPAAWIDEALSLLTPDGRTIRLQAAPAAGSR